VLLLGRCCNAASVVDSHCCGAAVVVWVLSSLVLSPSALFGSGWHSLQDQLAQQYLSAFTAASMDKRQPSFPSKCCGTAAMALWRRTLGLLEVLH
jgi:hypothetical protein